MSGGIGGIGGGGMGGIGGAGKMGMSQTSSVSQSKTDMALLIIQKKKNKSEDKSFEAMLLTLNQGVQNTQNTQKVGAAQSIAKGTVGTKVNKFA